MPSLLCLARMELNGFGFSEVECERLKSILQAKLRSLEEEAYRLANHSFSLTWYNNIFNRNISIGFPAGMFGCVSYSL